MSLTRHLFVCLVLSFNLAAAFASGEGEDLNCSPCIERSEYRIKAIVHGTSSERFWQRMRASSMQAARDMRVKLDFQLYDEYDENVMAADIEKASTDSSPPNALIVTIPTPVVASAVDAAADRIPVFGLNSGYDVASSLGVLDFIAMDEKQGGERAAEEFLSQNITRGLFVNHDKGNSALEDRLAGFTEGLGVDVDELEVNVTLPRARNINVITSALEGCEYDAILLAGSESTLEMTLQALEVAGCSDDVYVGGFDEGEKVYDAIATGQLLFTISQQPHLQGTLSVMLAAIYATTEKELSSSKADFGTYLSGPISITVKNLPSDTQKACADDAFPVCPKTVALDGITNSSCACLDRSTIKIAGVLHGVTTDSFWDVVFAQARQAADDLGVELILDRLEYQPPDVLYAKMASKIVSLCNEGVDGIFVSVPSESLATAIKQCRSLNIPVVSINSGANFAKELNITHHIAQLEYDAGFEAGHRMAETGIYAGVCLNHEPENTGLVERCEGFEAGLKDFNSDIEYLGSRSVPLDSRLVFVQETENFIDTRGDWDGIGALTVGPQTLRSLLAVKERHPKLRVATFDINSDVFEGLDDRTVLFGVDQNPFMQGYTPVWLLTIMAHTKQNLQNSYIKTGPRFVEYSPSVALQTCTDNHFKVCARPINKDLNQLVGIRPYGLTFAGISMALSVILLAWVVFNRETAVVRKSQPLFLGMICVGTFLMASTIIPLSIDDSIRSDEACSVACMVAPWCFWIGFIVTFSALSSKIERIRKLVDSAAAFRRVTVTAWDVMRPLLVLLTLTTILLLVWTIVDPMFWVRQSESGSIDGRSTYGSCALGHSDVSVAMLACLTVLAFGCVIRASVSAYHARKVSVEYSESKYISVIVIGMLQTFPIGIPLVALSNQNPTAKYFVMASIIFALTLSIQLLIFIPKMLWHKKELDSVNVRASSFSAVSSSRTGPMTRILDHGSSLRVIGMDMHTRGSTYDRNRETALATTAQDETDFAATEIVSGLTTKQVDDLQELLQGNDKITDITDLRSLLESIGIVVSDDWEQYRNSSHLSTSAKHPRTSSISRSSKNLSVSSVSVFGEAGKDGDQASP